MNNKTFMSNRRMKVVIHDPVEITYAGKYVFIPELNCRIKIADNSSLKEWVINYCSNNTHLKELLYKNYNILQDAV